MEPERLKIFVAVAELKSFSAAARRLYISHSTTSRAVSALETELGVRLMERGNQIIGLTRAGETLLKEAKALLAAADAAAQRVKAAAASASSADGEENPPVGGDAHIVR